MDREDGEMSDNSSMNVDSDPDTQVNMPEIHSRINDMDTSLENKFTIVYKSEKTGISVEKLERTDAKKLEERAKRFGLDLSGHRAITQKQIDELYENFNIQDGNERHFRFDTLHLNGVEDLSTKEIFEYLEDYKPVSLEYIDRNSCNVVCQDHISAALTLLVHSREIKNDELKKMVKMSSPHHWREGLPHHKKDLILIRFATNSDKKDSKVKSENKPQNRYASYDDFDVENNSSEKNPWGDLCKSWGIYDHQEVFNRPLIYNGEDNDESDECETHVKIKNKKLAKRLGRRQPKTSESDNSESDEGWKQKTKVPRMRMHADDEELKEKQKNKIQLLHIKNEKKDKEPATLSIEINNEEGSSFYTSKPTTNLSAKFKVNTHSQSNLNRNSIHNRLGQKVVYPESNSDDSSTSSSGSIGYNRVHTVSSKIERSNTNVWSRLDNKREQPKDDLRQRLKLKKKGDNSDLRKRLGNNVGDHRDRSPLRSKSPLRTSRTRVREGRSPLRIEINNDYYDDSD